MLGHDAISLCYIGLHTTKVLGPLSASLESLSGLQARKCAIHHRPALGEVLICLLMHTVADRNPGRARS